MQAVAVASKGRNVAPATLVVLPWTPATRRTRRGQESVREMTRNAARPIAMSCRRSPPSQALWVTAKRNGTTTALQLRGSLDWSELPLLDEMTDWLLIWSDRRLVVDIDRLSGSDALFATWIRHRQRRRLTAGDQILAHTSDTLRRNELITAGVSCDTHSRGAGAGRADPSAQHATTPNAESQTAGRSHGSGSDRHRRSPTGPSWGP